MPGELPPVRIFEVEGPLGYSGVFSARTRGAAKYQAWLDIGDFYAGDFFEFARKSRVRLAPGPGQGPLGERDGYRFMRRSRPALRSLRAGRRVRTKKYYERSDEGTVAVNRGEGPYVYVILDGEKHPHPWHPADIELIE